MTRSRAQLTALLALLAAVPGTADALNLEIQGQLLVASPTEAGVVFFGVSREIAFDDVVTRRSTAEIRTPEDRSGIVRLDLGRPVAPASVWVAVDLATGDFATVSPSGVVNQSDTFLGGGVGRAPSGNGVISDLRAQAEFLVVRPAVGSWTLTLGDGSPEDADGLADGQLAAPLDQMIPLAGAPPPTLDFLTGDVVLLVDPRTLEIVVSRIAGGAL